MLCKCVKGDPQQLLICRQKTTQNQMTSNNLQCEIDFTQKQIPRKTEKFSLLSANKVFAWHVKNIGAHFLIYNLGSKGPLSRLYIVHMKHHKLCDVLRPLSEILSRAPKF